MGSNMMAPQCTPLNVGVEVGTGGKLRCFSCRGLSTDLEVPRRVEDPARCGEALSLCQRRDSSTANVRCLPMCGTCVLGMGQTRFPDVPSDLRGGVGLQAAWASGGPEGRPCLRESRRNTWFNEDGAAIRTSK